MNMTQGCGGFRRLGREVPPIDVALKRQNPPPVEQTRGSGMDAMALFPAGHVDCNGLAVCVGPELQMRFSGLRLHGMIPQAAPGVNRYGGDRTVPFSLALALQFGMPTGARVSRLCDACKDRDERGGQCELGGGFHCGGLAFVFLFSLGPAYRTPKSITPFPFKPLTIFARAGNKSPVPCSPLALARHPLHRSSRKKGP